MMKKLNTLLAVILLTGLNPLVQAEEHAHWTYSGKTGPEHWSELKNDFSTCHLGKEQSPIDLKGPASAKEGGLEFNYQASPLRVIDNGHTIQVNFDSGSKATIHGKIYELVQMHFHTPSEHTIGGRSFPLELHLVHKDTQGKLAVVGVLFKEGAANPMLDRIFNNVPSVHEQEQKVAGQTMLGSDLMPKFYSHYHYNGSLTTPPCSEGVNWNVLSTPLTASKAQIDSFHRHYTDNHRPVQQLNGRSL